MRRSVGTTEAEDDTSVSATLARKREEAVLTRCLGDLLGGRAPPHNVVLTGPRGTGKTVLLNWFERTCRDYVTDVDVLKLTPDDIPTREALFEVLAPTPGLAKLLPRKLGVAAVGSVEWAPPAGGMRNLRQELTARCRRKPLATLVDEAHTLDLEVGRALLNASQQVRADAPFLLVLAGTPGLAAHLGAMNASFWSRLGEGRLGIGLLSDAAARAALVEPLAAHDEGIDADALATVVDDSQCYPYFIQLWGEAPLRARDSLADGLRTRPCRTGARRSTSRDQITLLALKPTWRHRHPGVPHHPAAADRADPDRVVEHVRTVHDNRQAQARPDRQRRRHLHELAPFPAEQTSP